MSGLERQKAEAMLWEWMEKVLQPHFGGKLSIDDLYPFLDEELCLLVPPESDDIFVIISALFNC